MMRFAITILVICPVAQFWAQAPGPTAAASNSTPASVADVETLREQVQSLTELVKALQQQVKDQQSLLHPDRM